MQDLRLFIAHRVGLEGNGRLHGGQRDQLQNVIRHHVAQRAGMVVIAAALLHAQRLRHGDLHVVDVAAIPDRLEDAVGEAEDQNILHRLLAQVMIDAIDLVFVQHLADFAVERARRIQIVPERLFDHHAAPAPVALLGQTGGSQLFDDISDQRGTW